jgi:small-conductance mechanosensitive channel
LVGIGLGLQQTFNDIFSGIILLFEGSIKVDDVLEVGDDVVKVRRIGLRASIVENRNQIIMIMPNSRIVTDTVINWSHTKKQSRFMINIGVAYGTDVELVCTILTESAKTHPLCSLDREPLSRLVNFGDSSLDFELYFWTEKMFEVEQTKSDIRKIIVSKFKEHEVVIPFPQRDLHFKSNSTSSTPKD